MVFDSLGKIVTVLIAAAFILVIGFLIFAQSRDVIRDDSPSLTVTEESVVWVNRTTVALVNSGRCAEGSLTCNSVENNESGQPANTTLNVGNYTCDCAGLTLSASVDTSFNVTNNVFVNYTFVPKTTGYNASETVTGATEDVTDWFAILVVVLVGSLLV